MVQQIHSFLASGVISSHAVNAALSEARHFRKSAGTLCTTPPGISFLVIILFYFRLVLFHSRPYQFFDNRNRELLIVREMNGRFSSYISAKNRKYRLQFWLQVSSLDPGRNSLRALTRLLINCKMPYPDVKRVRGRCTGTPVSAVNLRQDNPACRAPQPFAH